MTYKSPYQDPLSQWLDVLYGTDLTPLLVSRITNILQLSTFTPEIVVYVLSQIRKIIDYERKRNTYEVINFYSDWILHVKIDRSSQVILKEIEEILQGDRARNNYSIIDSGIQKGWAPDYMKLDVFKEQLKNFCMEFSIPEKNIQSNWKNFIKVVIDELVDFPISPNPDLDIRKGKINGRIISLSFKYIPEEEYYAFDTEKTQKKLFPSIFVRYDNHTTDTYVVLYNKKIFHQTAFF